MKSAAALLALVSFFEAYYCLPVSDAPTPGYTETRLAQGAVMYQWLRPNETTPGSHTKASPGKKPAPATKANPFAGLPVADLRKPGVKEVWKMVKPAGMFTAVVLDAAKTSCVGLKVGATTPDKFIVTQAADEKACLITNGGFFITGGDPFLRSDYQGALLDSNALMHFSVGPTSVTNNVVPVPGVHADYYHKLEGEDGSFLTCGPDLRQDFGVANLRPKKSNTKDQRLQYNVIGVRPPSNNALHPKEKPEKVAAPGKKPAMPAKLKPIHSPVYDEQAKNDHMFEEYRTLQAQGHGPSLRSDFEALQRQGRGRLTEKDIVFCNGQPGKELKEQKIKLYGAGDGGSEFIRTVFAHIPGGVATAREPNERAVLVYVGGGRKVAATYTVHDRSKGMSLMEMRDLLDVFLQKFANTNIKDVQKAINLDGGGSIFAGWIKDGKLQVIAAGSLVQMGGVSPEGQKFRQVTTMVKHTLE